MILHLACAIVEIALYAALVLASLHLARAAAWAWAQGPVDPLGVAPAEAGRALPFVTVQLPLRNEALVAEGALRAAAALAWPADRFEVQVLDDSDDATVEIVDRVAAALHEGGTAIEVLRRGSRQGYKAGALAHGLLRARGELVLVLDADFRPTPDFLGRLEAALADDEELAFVQARWTFRNERASLLTRLQAAILDALFAVEQARLSAQRTPVQFNGTGGLWRKEAILRAGGWATGEDALTEDLDLSFRAHEAGLRGMTLPQHAVSTELPEDVASFVAQQARWVRGGGLGLRALGRRLLARGAARDARTMLAHLARHARQPLFVAAIVRLALVAFAAVRSPLPAWVGPLIVAGTLASASLYFAAAARRLRGSIGARALLSPALAALSLGLAPALTIAFVGGMLGSSGGGFARTAKQGEGARVKPRSASSLSGARLSSFLLAATSLAALAAFARSGDVVGALAAALAAGGCAWMAL